MKDDGLRAVVPDGEPHVGSGLRWMSVATSLLGTVIGLQVMMSLFFLPYRGQPPVPSSLLTVGKEVYRPEQDTRIYVLGTAATLLLILFLGWHQKLRLRGVAPDRVDSEAAEVAAGYYILAALSMLSYLLILALVTYCRLVGDQGLRNPLIWKLSGHVRSTQLLFFLPTLSSMTLVLRGTRPPMAGRLAGLMRRRSGDDANGPCTTVRRKYAGCLWALGISVGVVLLLLLADPWTAAGASLIHDGLPFHHWDYYVMAAAIGYGRGRALGLDVYTQYGVGYPMLVNWLSPLFGLSYGNLYFLSSIYGCIYFLALAGLVRLRLGSWPWATVGVLVAAYLQVFNGVGEHGTLWMYPSSSILRYSMDVWFFGALWMHLKTGRSAWAALIGLTAGLALLMGFDTGIYLIVVLVFYLGIRLFFGPRGGLKEGFGLLGEMQSAALASTIALVVIVAGIAAATRRAPWAIDRRVLGSLFEAILVYSGGAAARPMSDDPQYWGQCLFLVVAGTYLACIGTLASSLIGPGAGSSLVFRGCLSAYGLGTLLIFVSRSHPFNLFHGIIPFAILAVDGMHAAVHRLTRPGWRGGLTALLGVGGLTLLLVDRDVREYPGVIQTALIGTPPPAVSFPRLGVRVAPIVPNISEFARDFEEVVSRVAEARKTGLRAAFLDEAETMFDLASGASPADRYNPLLPGLFFRTDLEQAKGRFVAQRFDLVIIRAETGSYPYNAGPGLLADIRGEFRRLVHQEYSPLTKIGRYQVWILPGSRTADDRVARSGATWSSD